MELIERVGHLEEAIRLAHAYANERNADVYFWLHLDGFNLALEKPATCANRIKVVYPHDYSEYYA